MSNLTKLEFVVLDILGNHFLSWIIDTTLQKKSLLARIKCPRKNSNIVAKGY